MIDVGLKNFIRKDIIIKVIKPNNSEAKMYLNEAKLNNRLIDCTQGKKTHCIVILKTRHIVLSTFKYTSMMQKLQSEIKEIPKPAETKKELALSSTV